jgi:hypothetical protein
MDSNDMGELLLLVLDDDLFWIEKEQETEDVETV